MGSILGQLLEGRGYRAEGNPNDERYWSPSMTNPHTSAGVMVTPDTALRASAVWACVRLIAETVGALPCLTYRRLSDGRELAANHPLYDVLHSQPNEEQTAIEYWETAVTHVLIRGNAYARKVPGRRGPVDQLMTITPDSIVVETLPEGRLRYRVTDRTGLQQPVLREDLFINRGLSLDGLTGVSVLAFARESIGLSMAAETYGARLFGQGTQLSGVLEYPGRLSKEVAERLAESWQRAHAGLHRAHRPAVLEDGMSWKPVSMTSDDAQFLQTREFQIADIARWFRVPLHMIGETSKATSWGSGIEQLSIGFVAYTLLPWLKRLEQAIARDLLIDPRTYYAEFLVQGLLRGDTSSRYTAYATGRQWGWLSINDIRRLENLNPISDGDDYLQPLNMVPAGTPAMPAAPPARDQQQALGPHYRLMIEDAAGRVVRKEVVALRKAASRTAASTADWQAAVDDFYRDHAGLVASTLRIPESEARGWVERQRRAVLTDGPAVLEQWETDGVAALAALVMEATK